jgi:restriction endonuclease S subunit
MKTPRASIIIAAIRLIHQRASELWGQCTITDLGAWALGTGFPIDRQGQTELPYLFCKVSDMNSPGNEVKINSTANSIDGTAAREIGARIHPPGTVIFPKIGGAIATNKRRILARHSAIDNNLLGIIPNRTTDPEWLYHFLRGLDFTAYQAGTSVPALKQSVIEQIAAPRLSIEVQRCIAAFITWLECRETVARENAPNLPTQLEDVKRVIARLEMFGDRIEKACELRQQVTEEMEFIMPRASAKTYDEAAERWGLRRLDDLCQQITDGTHWTPRYVETGIPFLSVKDITSGRISFDNVRYITADEHAALIKRCKPELGDVLLTKVGTTGFAKVIDVDREFSIFVSLALLKLKRDLLDPKFTEYMLNSTRLRDYSAEGTRGVGNKNLVLKFIREFPVPVPPLPEQRRIVAELDGLQAKADALKSLQSETSAELDALMPSILDKAFRGEL